MYLVSALELVQGQPFTVPEEKYDQWVWAFHHERFRDEYTALAKDLALIEIADEHPEKARETAQELLERLDEETGPGGPGKRSGAIDAVHRGAAGLR